MSTFDYTRLMQTRIDTYHAVVDWLIATRPFAPLMSTQEWDASGQHCIHRIYWRLTDTQWCEIDIYSDRQLTIRWQTHTCYCQTVTDVIDYLRTQLTEETTHA